MKFTILGSMLLLSSLVLAQAAPPTAQKKTPAKPAAPAATAPATKAEPAPSAGAAVNVPADAPVITIEGLCKTKTANAADCKTIVTRAQFDKLTDALAAGRPIPPQTKRRLATDYSNLLLLAAEAEKQGLENKPETQELFRFVRLQALAQAMTRSMQDKAQPSAEEVQKFYNDNSGKFKQLTLERVMIPNKPAEGKTEADTKKIADDLRQRAASGADFKTLQAEAYEKAGLQNPPETKLIVQPDSLPPNLKSILQMKPGDITPVIQEPTGYYIYKFEGEQQVPLDKVSDDIKKALTQQKMEQEVNGVLKTTNTKLNDQYFGEAAPAQSGPGVRPAPAPVAPPPAKP